MQENKSIEQLFTTHHSRLVRLATALLHDEEEARDAVSEVFEKLMKGSPKDESTLFAAVRHSCIDRIRQMEVAERVRRRLPLDEAELSIWEQEEEYEQLLEAVSEAIESELTTKQRRTLLLRYYEEKSYREIAGILDISEVAVYKHLRSALERLRRKVKRKGEDN